MFSLIVRCIELVDSARRKEETAAGRISGFPEPAGEGESAIVPAGACTSDESRARWAEAELEASQRCLAGAQLLTVDGNFRGGAGRV